MTSAFSWQNSTSLCPVSFYTFRILEVCSCSYKPYSLIGKKSNKCKSKRYFNKYRGENKECEDGLGRAMSTESLPELRPE